MLGPTWLTLDPILKYWIWLHPTVNQRVMLASHVRQWVMLDPIVKYWFMLGPTGNCEVIYFRLHLMK